MECQNTVACKYVSCSACNHRPVQLEDEKPPYLQATLYQHYISI